jgi:hypothetical protein
MTETERTEALANLAKTRDAFQQAVSGLSEAQARFKPSADRWSIEELVEHVALAEHGMYRLITELHEKSDDPREAESAASLARARDRKTIPLAAPERVLPKGRFGGLSGGLDRFLQNRARTMDYVQACQDDLRSRLIQHPIGLLNGRDCLRILTFHPARHVEQINELKADSAFPRS